MLIPNKVLNYELEDVHFFKLYSAIIWGRKNLLSSKHTKDKSTDQPVRREARVAAALKVALKYSKQMCEPKMSKYGTHCLL